MKKINDMFLLHEKLKVVLRKESSPQKYNGASIGTDINNSV